MHLLESLVMLICKRVQERSVLTDGVIHIILLTMDNYQGQSITPGYLLVKYDRIAAIAT